MSTWRRKAIECLPEQKHEIEQPGTSIYTVFFELLPAVRDAHISNDVPKLQKIYAFAEWCFRQKQEDLWNAAGVAFYEHLGDEKETFEAMPRWVKKDIYLDIRDLLGNRITDEKIKELDDAYGITFIKYRR